VRAGKLDLVTCGREEAERAVASLLKKLEAAAAARAKLRDVRTSAQTYRLEQRLVELSHFATLDPFHEFIDPARTIADAQRVSPGAMRRPLRAQRSLARTRAELCRT
jgi:hypothetical protein